MLDFGAYFLHSPFIQKTTLVHSTKTDFESLHKKASNVVRECDRIKESLLCRRVSIAHTIDQ